MTSITNVPHQTETPRIQLDPSWMAVLGDEFQKDYMKDLRKFLSHELKAGKKIFPAGPHYFEALNRTPFEKVKVVILGQDPYHGVGQAHGLSFSVPPGVPQPPSLLNIMKELAADLSVPTPKSGDLSAWAEQGVLLLNSVLTVEMGKAASHQNRGWEKFTDRVIQELNQRREGLVFILWGSYAQKKASFVDTKKHLVLTSVHPSPLSSHRGFFGSRPFSKANAWLKQHGKAPIHWA